MVALTWLAADADTIWPPDQLHGVFVHFHQADGVHPWQDPAVEAAGPNLGQKALRATGSRDVSPAPNPQNAYIQHTGELAPHHTAKTLQADANACQTRTKQPCWVSNPARPAGTLWGRGKAAGPYVVVEVSQAAVALGGPVELGHLGDAEAGHELPPDGSPQPIAQRHAHPVLPLHLLVGLVQQVAADLPDVLHDLGGTERKDTLGPCTRPWGR